jgi:hypothetical protein
MSVTTWKFSVSYHGENYFGTRATGIFAKSPTDVESLSKLSGIPYVEGGGKIVMEVEELEGSQTLRSLLARIEELYGFRPSQSRLIRKYDREKVFGVEKNRQYSTAEINESPFIYISHVENIIARNGDRNERQIAADQYVAEAYKGNKKTSIGTLSPFHAIGISTTLKVRLESAELSGLILDPIIGVDGLWRLNSSIIMPRCKLPLLDSNGENVGCDDWPDKFSDKYFDDEGYYPPELRYGIESLKSVGDFDIAMTIERTGVTNARAFRWTVVSQKFRTTLDDLGVTGIRYTPVRIDDETEKNT